MIGYHGGGAFNQIILVLPEKNIVFAAHSYIDGRFRFHSQSSETPSVDS